MSYTRRKFMQNGVIAGLGTTIFSMRGHGANNEVYPAPMMPTPNFVETNSINMAVYEKGTGPAVVFCHGWPELAFSWRDQIDAVADAGYHAIAPDQRGFGLTGGPEDPMQYDLGIFCDDLLGMMDVKGIEKAVFCGHDWGGAVVWAMAKLHPDRCLGVIGLSTAASRPSSLPPVEGSKPPLIIMSPRYYSETFQQPGYAESILETNVHKFFDFMFSRGGIWDTEAFARLPEDSDERHMDLLAMLQRENPPPGEPFISDDVMKYFTDTYTATGFTGGLNWYRAMGRIGSVMADAEPRIEVPSLYIGAENDLFLPPSRADGMEDFISDLEKHTVLDSGHWIQQEQPEEVNRVIVEWLNRKIS